MWLHSFKHFSMTRCPQLEARYCNHFFFGPSFTRLPPTSVYLYYHASVSLLLFPYLHYQPLNSKCTKTRCLTFFFFILYYFVKKSKTADITLRDIQQMTPSDLLKVTFMEIWNTFSMSTSQNLYTHKTERTSGTEKHSH